ncbi:MAG: peptide MFS transporter [Marinifilaceae bacterium]
MRKDRHPNGLMVLFSTEMFERFSFYSMRALLILYLTKSLLFNKELASNIYGSYAGAVYVMAIFGGFVADRFWGTRKSVIIGGLLMAIGQFSMYMSATLYTSPKAIIFLYAGLSILALGNGFLKPNISVMIGDLYPRNDRRVESAFTIFYMGINIGAFVGPLFGGFLGETGNPADFRWGFLLACIGMLIGLAVFTTFMNKYLRVPEGQLIGKKPTRNNNAKNSKLTSGDRKRIGAIVIMSCVMIFFWSAFEQSGISLTFLADEHIDRTLFGFTIPASIFQVINPAAILLFAPLFVIIWDKLGSRNPCIPVKMGIGLYLLGIGFIIISWAAKSIEINQKISIGWIVLMYFFHTWGELSISPIGLSMVKKLSPAKLVSLLMGMWFLTTGIANKTAGVLATLYPDGSTKSICGFQIETISDFYMIFVVLAFLSGTILLLCSPWIKKMMNS